MCVCCGKGLLKIKCPYREDIKTKNGEEIAKNGNYCLKIENQKIQLKENSQWYTQVQTQLFVTDLSWCDFVIFTIQRISFNKDRFDLDLQRALNLHEEYVMPKLLHS